MLVSSSIEIWLRVVDRDEVAELLVAGERRGLAGDALLQVAVAGDHVDEVVERARARGGVRVEQAALVARGVGEADRGGEALAERAGGDLDAVGVAVLGVAGGQRAPGAQRLEVLELEAVAAQVELDVLRERGVPGRQDEAVAAEPVRVGRVAAHAPSGTAGTRRAPGSSRCRDGRCRPSRRHPPPGPGRCPPRVDRSHPTAVPTLQSPFQDSERARCLRVTRDFTERRGTRRARE